MPNYWTGLAIIQQAAGELGIARPTTIQGTVDDGTNQLLALTNAAGNELLTYYPWQQFKLQWAFTTTTDESYDLPANWNYFVDQTQWDTTNHWPLLGPKSPQEWAWLKSGLLASAPRIRYRIMDNKFYIWPIPSPGYGLSMEYMSNAWAQDVSGTPYPNGTPIMMLTKDTDVVMYDPWLMVKFLKLKFYQLKAFDTAGVLSDFTRTFESLTGKDVGAPVLSLVNGAPEMFIGPWSVPDGSWVVGP